MKPVYCSNPKCAKLLVEHMDYGVLMMTCRHCKEVVVLDRRFKPVIA